MVEVTQADNLRLEALARTDPLTQLLNRRALLTHLGTEVERTRRYNAPLSILMAKDYAGAAALVPYFLLALTAIFILAEH